MGQYRKEYEKALDHLVEVHDLQAPFTMFFNNWWRNEKYTPQQKNVYLTLKTFAGQDKKCFPSQSTVAKIIGSSRSTVNKIIKELEELGALVSVKVYNNDGSISSCRYFLADIDGHSGEFITSSLLPYVDLKLELMDRNEVKKPKGGRPKKTAEQKLKIAEKQVAKSHKILQDAKKALAETSALS